MYECYQEPGSLWILPGSKIRTWSRQWKMPQAAKEDNPNNDLCCSKQTATPNFASCLTLSVQARVCNEGNGKTRRLLWNREEGMFPSGSKANPWGLIVGTSDLTRRLQWLQWHPGKAGLASYHEGKYGPRPKMLIHEPKAIGCWSPAQSILWVPLEELLKTERSGFGWIPFERGVVNVKRLLEETPHRLQERSEERAIWGKKSLQPQYWIIDRVGLLNVPWLPWILRYSLAATLTSAGEVECLMFKWLPKIRQMLISCLTWQTEMTTWLLQIDF